MKKEQTCGSQEVTMEWQKRQKEKQNIFFCHIYSPNAICICIFQKEKFWFMWQKIE